MFLCVESPWPKRPPCTSAQATSISYGGLWPSAEGFFCPSAKKRSYYDVLAHFRQFLVFSSNLGITYIYYLYILLIYILNFVTQKYFPRLELQCSAYFSSECQLRCNPWIPELLGYPVHESNINSWHLYLIAIFLKIFRFICHLID